MGSAADVRYGVQIYSRSRRCPRVCLWLEKIDIEIDESGRLRLQPESLAFPMWQGEGFGALIRCLANHRPVLVGFRADTPGSFAETLFQQRPQSWNPRDPIRTRPLWRTLSAHLECAH